MTDLVSLLDQHARTVPHKECLRTAGKSWTYAEFAEQTRRAASVLRDRGIGPGDRVGLLCFNTPGFPIALFGAWRLGAVVVPINHKSQAPEVDYMLSHSRTRLCLIDGALAPLKARVAHPTDWLGTDSEAAGLPSFDELLAHAEPLAGRHAPAADSLAEILYTSGTTGKPKGCLHSHDNVFHAALCAAAANGLTPRERMLIAMPVWHSSPLNNWLLGTMLVGGTTVLMREYAPKAFLEVMAAERITFTFGAPIAFLAPLAVVPDVAAYDLSHMRQCAYGGGPLGADMARRLAECYRTDRFVQVYGMTESGPLGTVLYPEDAQAKAGSIGRSGVPGVELQVRRADGRLCGPGEVGEIHLRTPAMMQGYLDNPEATAAAFDDEGWYRSGDLAQVDEDGFLFIVDRLKDMIISGGENVYSKEVEDVLGACPGIEQAAVIGRPHPEWGETVVAVMVARLGERPQVAEVRSFLEQRLARYKIPRVFEWRETLPRTPTGKVVKHMLREAQNASATAPSNPGN